MEMKAVGSDQPVAAREPRRRFVASLLYGRNVDRTAKTRARLGLAVLIFALGYAIIAARLVMFAAAPEGHGSRRAIAQDAVATARPDILDRNGEILATDVRTPSLFAEPQRIIDADEASELLTAVMPDIDAAELRERLATGLYEMGSTFKALTLAMALDSGKVTLKSSYDASHPLQYGKFAIHDYHAQNRVLTVPEIFTYSSNIGTARMAVSLGVEYHKAFLRKMGQLERLRTELPESAEPLVPKRWVELNTVTIAFGHGLSVAPLQAVMAIGALMNGGRLIPPTFLKRSEAEAQALAKQVIKPETSEKMRYLMRLNVEKGTATRADVKGYYVGGKTGTSDKVVGGRYSKTKVLTSFTAVMPADQPRYLLLIMLDEPQATPDTHGFTTSGWNAVPVGGAVISRIAPLLGLEPRFELPPADKLILASAGGR